VNGNLRFLLLPSGVSGNPTVVEWEYEDLDRPFRRRTNGASQVNWGYDGGATNGIGRLERHRTDSYEYVVRAYDLLGRPTHERIFSPIAVPSHNLYTLYDPLGQVAQRTYPGFAPVQWTRDAEGYLTEIETAQGDYATGIQWDALGRLQEWTAGNGFRTIRTYDPAKTRLAALEIRNENSQSTIQQLAYSYDDGDRLTGITHSDPLLSLSNITYQGSQLKSVTGPFGADRAQMPIYNSYDTLGNLTCRESTSASQCLDGTALQYPAPGSPRPHAPIAIDGQIVLYDAMGNISNIGAGAGSQGYSYTLLGQLSSVSVAGVTQASFGYDANGRLVHLTNDLGQLLHLLTPDFEWNQTTDLGRIRIGLGGTTIAVQSFAYDPEQPPGGCAWVVPSRPGQGGSVLELFLPGLAALTLLWLERAYRRRRAIGWRPIAALTTTTVFVLSPARGRAG
jgi:YD repeat-containing protein